MWVGSRDGRHFDANFIVTQPSSIVIFYEAWGGKAERARNTEYGDGLVRTIAGSASWGSYRRDPRGNGRDQSAATRGTSDSPQEISVSDLSSFVHRDDGS